jgi:hypothetical protein
MLTFWAQRILLDFGISSEFYENKFCFAQVKKGHTKIPNRIECYFI